MAKTSWNSLLEWTPLEPEERWRPSTLSFHPSFLSWVGYSPRRGAPTRPLLGYTAESYTKVSPGGSMVFCHGQLQWSGSSRAVGSAEDSEWLSSICAWERRQAQRYSPKAKVLNTHMHTHTHPLIHRSTSWSEGPLVYLGHCPQHVHMYKEYRRTREGWGSEFLWPWSRAHPLDQSPFQEPRATDSGSKSKTRDEKSTPTLLHDNWLQRPTHHGMVSHTGSWTAQLP